MASQSSTFLTTILLGCLTTGALGQTLAMAPLNKDGWIIQGDEQRCVVTQAVPDWGMVRLESSVRGQLTWLFTPYTPTANQRVVSFESHTPPWQHPTIIDPVQYRVQIREGHFVIEGNSAANLLDAINNGRMATLTYQSAGETRAVGAMPVGMPAVASDFQTCLAGLPAELPEPPSLAAARKKLEDELAAMAEPEAPEEEPPLLQPWTAKDTRVLSYALGEHTLDEMRKQQLFNMVADYLMAPASAKLAIITPNDEDSRIRREVVANYLTEQGMDATMLTVQIDPAQSGVRLKIVK
ncbi:MAG: hypothetical protein HWE20_01015 [Gammaproteobacteria bacterium]|nr:hypothetical protein [Gammaproteobacteria bacterium]